ncbi:hypothetical protein CAPTEDRAFT_186916 [Capitella teleta]|uniref:RRM domain-containing protein n=1 Tax=Capitella teleta TaxID=283909 RepID=R7TLW4_CAPTE|nr:hypothetical protein CAPTEDRAFT_186916 [Capitella teleta]|eukprot:ELT92551.1 hypothetical protein CAPTEDRAFT_186916 [Capitella teleta]
MDDIKDLLDVQKSVLIKDTELEKDAIKKILTDSCVNVDKIIKHGETAFVQFKTQTDAIRIVEKMPQHLKICLLDQGTEKKSQMTTADAYVQTDSSRSDDTMGFQNLHVSQSQEEQFVTAPLDNGYQAHSSPRKSATTPTSQTYSDDFWKYILKCRGLLLKNLEEANGVKFQAANESPDVVRVTTLTTNGSGSSLDALQAIDELYRQMKPQLTKEELQIPPWTKGSSSLQQYANEIRGMYFNLLVNLSRDVIQLYGFKKTVALARQDLRVLLDNHQHTPNDHWKTSGFPQTKNNFHPPQNFTFSEHKKMASGYDKSHGVAPYEAPANKDPPRRVQHNDLSVEPIPVNSNHDGSKQKRGGRKGHAPKKSKKKRNKNKKY